MATTIEDKRSRLLQADTAMASLQADIEQRRDNNLAKIQKSCDALHKCVDEQMEALRQNVHDETANSLSLIKERREKLTALANKLRQIGSGRSGFTEEQITEINKQYAELQCGAVEEIYQTRCQTAEVSLPQLGSPIYKTEVVLPQLDSISSRTPSRSKSTAERPVVDLNNCSVDDVTVPKGKNSSFTLTLRNSEGQVLKGCSSYIKITVLATGKGMYEAVRIEEQANGSYLVSYTPKSIGATYQITVKIDGKQLPGSPYTLQPYWRDYSQLGNDIKIADGFNFPWGVVCGPNNEIIITLPHKLQVIDQKLRFLKDYGSEGSAQGQFCGPAGIAIHSTNNTTVLAVSDCRNHRIQKFSYFQTDTTITPLAVIGKKGDEELEFNMPRGLTFTTDGGLIVCDAENHRIQIISRSNKFVRSFGEKGSNPGQFNEPNDVAVRAYNSIVVADRLNHRVQCFTMDGHFTVTLDIADNQFPRGVFVTPDQSVIITAGSAGSDKILIVKEGEKLLSLGKKGRLPGEFNLPMGVTMDTDGRVAVADHWNKRIMVLA